MFVSPFKRRILVNKFQYRLLAGNFLYLTTIVLAFFVVLVGPAMATLFNDTVTSGQREVAARQLLVLHERVLFAMPLLIALCVFHSALVSHRIAGPLFRFKQLFSEMARGNFSSDVRVRKHDYLRDEAEAIAAMVSSMGERLRAIRTAYEDSSRSLDELTRAVGRESHADAAVLAGKLGTEMDALGRKIDAFRVPSVELEPGPESAAAPPPPRITAPTA